MSDPAGNPKQPAKLPAMQPDAGNAMADHPVLAPGILTGLHVLEADAGTGKTWTVSRLVVRAIVERDLNITQVAVLTFTNAAAAELRERIGQLLDRWSRDVNDDADPFWQAWDPGIDRQERQARLRLARLQLDEAPIGTIHSFCQRILSDYALSIGRWDHPEPGPDEDDALDEATARWWREHVSSAGADVVSLVGGNGLSLGKLRDILKVAIKDPGARIATRVERDPARPFELNAFPAQLDAAFKRFRQAWLNDRDSYLDWLTGPDFDLSKTTYKPDKVAALVDGLDQFIQHFPASLAQGCDMLTFLEKKKLAASFKKGSDESIVDRFSCFAAAGELLDCLRELEDLSAVVATTIRDEIKTQIRLVQQRQGVVGFDDLMHQTREALDTPELGDLLAQALRARYRLAFIDEFQDTDPAQWAIFNAVYCPADQTLVQGTAEGCGLILVGDPKQSIYAFRHADIHTYFSVAAQSDSRFRLSQNHRSNGLLIDSVNAVFARNAAFASDDITMTPTRHGRQADNPLTQPPDDGIGALSVLLLESGAVPEQSGNRYLAQQSAEACAAEIRHLLSGSMARAADIAVLVPSRNDGQSVHRALHSLGIGAVEISRDSVFASSEALDLFRIVCAVGAPGRADLVRGAMATQLLGFGLTELEQGVDDPVRWQSWLQSFSRARERWVRAGPQAALRDLLFRDFQRAAPLAALQRGERRLTNLLHLLSLLGEDSFAVAGAAQGQAWLGRHIRYAREESASDGAQVRLESDDNLVSIITIHSSKGLQFPFVFLPFAWRAPNSKSPPVSHFYDPSTNGRWITDNQRSRWDGDNPHAQTFGSAAAIGRFRESIRLMYVALTRAERRCYVFWANADRQGVLPPPLAWLLDASMVLPDDPKSLNKRKPLRADPATITDQWQQVAENTPGCIVMSMTSLHDRHALAANADLPAPDQPADQRVALVPSRLGQLDRVVEASWSSRSFTSLSRDVDEDLNRPDHDQLSEPGLLLRDAGAAEETGLLPIAARFPRGANPGTCLHDILEVADFQKPLDAARVARTLKRYAIEQDATEVADWMNQVLATTLTGAAAQADQGLQHSPFSLNQLAWKDTIRELPYTLSVSKLRPERISTILARQYAVPTLTQSAWSGFLNGFIDLLVRREGQYWIIDWKSNWLGETTADYGDSGLQAAMTEHAYNLQMSLYTVAVHRMLRHRLAGYNYQSHFGGVHYLFLRGMQGGNSGFGVYSSRLEESLLVELEAALDGTNER